MRALRPGEDLGDSPDLMGSGFGYLGEYLNATFYDLQQNFVFYQIPLKTKSGGSFSPNTIQGTSWNGIYSETKKQETQL